MKTQEQQDEYLEVLTERYVTDYLSEIGQKPNCRQHDLLVERIRLLMPSDGTRAELRRALYDELKSAKVF